GKSPKEIGDRVASHFVESPHQNFGRPGKPNKITYPEVCAWYGALTFAKATNNDELKQQLVKRFDPLFDEEKHYVPTPTNVDATVFCAVPFELYIQTKDKKYLDMALTMADAQWAEPNAKAATQPMVMDAVSKGLSWHTRMWIDDMFMIT